MEDYKYKTITGDIIGASMQVHKILGNGFTHGEFFLLGVHEALQFRKSSIKEL
jgi:hypothetical protein